MKCGVGKDCYLFHSMIGHHCSEFMDLMRNNGRDPDFEKFFNFYYAENSVEKIEQNLGLDLREIICCASKKDSAVTYHRPFGLILSGEVKIMFDNDSGLTMLSDGTYPVEHHYTFAHKTDLQTIMTKWYDKFSESSIFTWNEAILKKNSKIIGAFHDPFFDTKLMYNAYQSTFKEEEYSRFLEKVTELGLDLIEINSRFNRS